MMGMMFLPVIILLVAFSLIVNVVGSLGSSISNVAQGGQIVINNRELEAYASREYAVEFNNAKDIEDNILLVFLADESRESYYTIAWVGDNIANDINYMFGNEYTEYGYAMKGNINSYFENSISKNLASMVDTMTDKIVNLNLKSNFIENNGSPGNYSSHVTNHSNMNVNEETINRALETFTEETSIPIVIVIDEYENVFTRTVQSADVMTILFAIAMVGVAAYLIIKSVKNNDNNGQTEEERRNNSTSW